MVAIHENLASANADSSRVFTWFHFLARDPKYEKGKPYLIRGAWESAFPWTNIKIVKHHVEVRDLRPLLQKRLHEGWWTNHGFQIMRATHTMTYEEYNNDEVIRTIRTPQILLLLQARLKVAYIHVLDYRVCPMARRVQASR